MERATYQVGERRPLASRGWTISERCARTLTARGITPNAISVAGMISAIIAGIAFALTAKASIAWPFWLAGALFVQLRLAANLLDGMVAVQRKQASPVGELFNEVPDRVSDAATLIGLGYAAGSNVSLGFVAACVAIFVAYVRVQAKVAGAPQDFCGPMAKPQRMAAVTVAALICAIVPLAVQWQLPKLTLLLIVAGGVITAIRRLARAAAELRKS